MSSVHTAQPARKPVNAKTKIDGIEALYKAIGITAVAAACQAKAKKGVNGGLKR